MIFENVILPSFFALATPSAADPPSGLRANFRVNLFDRASGVDDPDALGRLARQSEKAFTDSIVKAPSLGFEAIGGLAAAPAVSPVKSDDGRAIEHEGELRQQAEPCGSFDGAHEIERQPASVGLVGERRFRISIAEHDLAPRERRPDNRLHVLGAIGEDEKQLGESRGGERIVKKERADPLAERCASRLAGYAHAKARLFERPCEKRDVGALAASLDPFDGNEQIRQLAVSWPSTSRMP